MIQYTFNPSLTLALGLALLLLGRWIKSKIVFLQKYFIPAPVIGGLIFSIVTLIGYSTQTFQFTFDTQLSSLFMIAFFTTVGFSASLKTLAKGGIQVVIFLVVATVLTVFQNAIGVTMASIFGINPLLGFAAGSVSLTGGHGNAAAFGPVLEAAGAVGGTTVSVAAATFGLVVGCMIGGPVGKKLMEKHKLVGNTLEKVSFVTETKIDKDLKELSEEKIFRGLIFIIISMGIGSLLTNLLDSFNITLAAYIGPMLIAAIFRNIVDSMHKEMPEEEIFIIGNISLSLFLSMALMTMRLWELASLAVPLAIILAVQTLFVATFVYFITFRAMGKDYDAAVMSTGHCGFALGATPNAMANMEAFTSINGPSIKAFFVVPLVGALFIDFTNAILITAFIELVRNMF